MPKTTKVRMPKSRPSAAKPQVDEIDKFRCTRCGTIYQKQKGNFYVTQSPLFRKNGGFLPVCNNCIDGLLEHYEEVLGSEREAFERLCLKFDIYWNPELYESAIKSPSVRTMSHIKLYMGKMNLVMCVGKTYDDTLDEEARGMAIPILDAEEGGEEMDVSLLGRPIAAPGEVKMPTEQTVLFWGSGFTPEFYHELEIRYAKWTKGVKKPIDPATEALYKQICIAEATINKNLMNGKNVEQTQNTLNTLLGSLNLKPNQKEDSANGMDSTPLGVWIKRWEEKRPVPQSDPEMKDDSGIIRYISVWFYGHLCKMLGIKNSYSKLYEEEIAKYRVTKPEYSGEDDEDVFNDVFGGGDDA